MTSEIRCSYLKLVIAGVVSAAGWGEKCGMARKLRLEYPGALYHIINRGNHRRWIYEAASTRTAFEACLLDGYERSGWLLHALSSWGITIIWRWRPRGKPRRGHEWLQATFANRFHRLRRENGHLFQGRYKSLLLEVGPVLGAICDYIPLNREIAKA